jgi:hypothetical protein
MTWIGEGPKAYGVRAETVRSVTRSCQGADLVMVKAAMVTDLPSIRMVEKQV